MLPKASPAPPWLLTPVMVNFRTAAFAYFMGCLLSLPIALAMNCFNLRPFDPPEWTSLFYPWAFIGSFVILPFWCGLALHDQPILRRMGFIFFALYLVLGLFSVLLP